jgi:hypothetical protein
MTPWEGTVNSSEPCGSLPVTTIHVSASYCEHHMAWSATTMTCRQAAEDDIRVVASATVRFGPFDNEADVRGWCVRALLAMEDLAP